MIRGYGRNVRLVPQADIRKMADLHKAALARESEPVVFRHFASRQANSITAAPAAAAMAEQIDLSVSSIHWFSDRQAHKPPDRANQLEPDCSDGYHKKECVVRVRQPPQMIHPELSAYRRRCASGPSASAAVVTPLPFGLTKKPGR